MKRNVLLVCSLIGALGLTSVVSAWWIKGHESVAQSAASGLPEGMPAFFRAGGNPLANYAGDPDRWKNPACKFLREATAPDHYLDLEEWQGKPLPRGRYQALALLQELKVKPDKGGMLPYALMEWYERLTCAFQEHRASPDNAAIRAKCLVHAGVLAHFTGDAAMPLHTTRHYDGRLEADGKITQKGIHARLDSFPEKHGLGAEEIGRDLQAREMEDVWLYIVQFINDSHTYIDRCYELDAQGLFERPNAESKKFVLERCRRGAQFTMDLWYTAWLRSATLPKQ